MRRPDPYRPPRAGRRPAPRPPARRGRSHARSHRIPLDDLPGGALRGLAALGASTIFAVCAALAAPAPLAAQLETISLDELRQANEVDSAYATPALRAFVDSAAAVAGRLPALLESYHARVESEIAIVQAEPSGRESVLQLEQVASDVLWRRDRPTVQRVVNYRARTIGPIPSALSLFEVPWVVPTLYGDRIDLVRWTEPAIDEEGRVRRRRAIHPLGAERARVYRFTGGDTVLTLNLPERTIPLVRVHVEPARLPDRPTLLFEGWMDIDATRMQIVRMRGRMISADPDPSADERLLGAVFRGATFVEFESAEYDGRFWLPRYQRIEVQALSRFTESRVALRVVSRFDHPWTNETGPLADAYPDPPAGGLLVLGDAVRRASEGEDGHADGGSVAGDGDAWAHDLGELTAEANVQDFRDLEPDADPHDGSARFGFGARHLSQLFRVNDPEGVFTGLAVTWRPGDVWSEGRVQAHAGWAWAEETARGGITVAHAPAGSRWELVARAERQILGTADFGPGYGEEPGVPPLVAGEDEAMFDHLVGGLIFRQPRDAGWAWRVEASRAYDGLPGNLPDLPAVDETAGTAARLGSGPGIAARTGDPEAARQTGDGETHPGVLARRRVEEGAYWLGRVTLERNPGAAGFGVVPGTALRLEALGGTGELDFLRLEAGASVRRLVGDLSLEGRVDGGALLSSAPPPQRLFELGRYGGLPGYEPRAFVGDRVALVQSAVSYTLPVLRRPLKVGDLFLPAVAPAPTVILRAGWTDASDDAAPVLESLGARTSDGVRASLGLRLRLFGGGISVGAARPLESGGEWRFVWSLAREF